MESQGNLCPWSSSSSLLGWFSAVSLPPLSHSSCTAIFTLPWMCYPRGGSSSSAGLGPGTAGLEPAGPQTPTGSPQGGGHGQDSSGWGERDGSLWKGGITMERRDCYGKEGGSLWKGGIVMERRDRRGKEGSLWKGGLLLPFLAAARSL